LRIKKNYKYWKTGDWEFKSRKATKKELENARKQAKELLKKTKGQAVTWRSCWECNQAHTHFLDGRWGDWILNCFCCGRFFYNKIDITEYEKEEKISHE